MKAVVLLVFLIALGVNGYTLYQPHDIPDTEQEDELPPNYQISDDEDATANVADTADDADCEISGAQSQPGGSRMGCNDCRLVILEVLRRVGRVPTAEAVRRALEDMCDAVPNPIARELCKQVADQKAPVIAQLLAKGLKPLEVCRALGYC